MSKALISTFNNNQEFDGSKIKKFISFKYEKIDEKVKEIMQVINQVTIFNNQIDGQLMEVFHLDH